MKSIENIQDIVNINSITRIVLKFSAVWCAPCKQLAPILEKIEKESANINFYSVDIDKASELTKSFDIKSVPTLVILQNGKELKRCAGFQSYPKLKQFVNE